MQSDVACARSMKTVSPKTIEIADEYWAADLGCAREDLRPPEPRIQAHAGGLTGYQGVFALTLGPAPIVSVPPELTGVVAPRAGEFVAATVADPDALRSLLGPAAVAQIIGPAYLTYADASSLSNLDPGNARELTALDRGAFDGLKQACPAEDWDPKGFGLDGQHTFGAFRDDGALLAVANFEIWGCRIAHLSVIAHPQARSQGHGRRAVAAAARCALADDLILQYRALKENLPSLRIAERLGFEMYGWSMAARLAP
jgi:GNAT superfamily N-acetyltransferase